MLKMCLVGNFEMGLEDISGDIILTPAQLDE